MKTFVFLSEGVAVRSDLIQQLYSFERVDGEFSLEIKLSIESNYLYKFDTREFRAAAFDHIISQLEECTCSRK